GTLEQLAGEMADSALPCGLLFDSRRVAMRSPLGLVAHVSLRLQVAEDREHRGVSEIVAELLLHLCDGGRTLLPQHGHDLGFAIGECHAHFLAASSATRT